MDSDLPPMPLPLSVVVSAPSDRVMSVEGGFEGGWVWDWGWGCGTGGEGGVGISSWESA